MSGQVTLDEIPDPDIIRINYQTAGQQLLEGIRLGQRDLNVRGNPPSAVYGSSGIGGVDVVVVVLATLRIIVVVQRHGREIALDEAAAGCVVAGGGKS
jgi:hypothetical protein